MNRRNDIVRRIGLGLGVLVVWSFSAGRAPAQDASAEPALEAGDSAPHAGESVHLHTPLDVDPALTVRAVLDAALAIHPQRYALAALEETADAWRRTGSNLLARSPVVTFTGLSDSPLDNRGQSEFEAGVDLPLWRLGEKAAARSVADSASDESVAAARALELELAGIIRAILWDIASAEQALEQARAALEVTTELAGVVERRAERGDLPRADVLLAQAAQYERSVAIVELEAMLFDAERSYRALTGLDARPSVFAEIESDREDLDASHPLLAMASRELERAAAELEYTEKARRGNPVLSIGPKRQHDAFGNYYNDSMTVGIMMPFGGGNHAVVERAEASGEVAAARSRLASLERQLDLDLHEAEHELFVIGESLELVDESAELAARRLELSRSAFEQGEIELQELLRVQDAAIGAAGAAAALRIRRERTIAALNQALGELP